MRKAVVERERKDFADFYQRSRDDCLRAVLASADDRALAEDLVAEGFARAWASWQKVTGQPQKGCGGATTTATPSTVD
jgi:RNA polymerase sigma-70 factor (ECF subfamily)